MRRFGSGLLSGLYIVCSLAGISHIFFLLYSLSLLRVFCSLAWILFTQFVFFFIYFCSFCCCFATTLICKCAFKDTSAIWFIVLIRFFSQSEQQQKNPFVLREHNIKIMCKKAQKKCLRFIHLPKWRHAVI